jgi:hypothetical protein
MDNYTFKVLSVEDLESLNELFKSAFSIAPNEDLFKWKYFSNPAGNAILAGAFHHEKLVCSGAMVPEKMNVFGQERIIYKCTDLMTHPLHQRKGLSKKLNELLIERTGEMNTPFSYTLCSKISTKSFLRNNWHYIGEVTNFFKPYPLLKINSFFNKKKFEKLKGYDGIDDHLDNYTFQADSSGISVNKNPSYLKWRISHPNFTYRLICHYNIRNEVDGYLIYSISSNQLMNIIDVGSCVPDKSIIDELLSFAEHTCLKESYRGVVIMAINKTPFYDLIKKKNYLRNPLNKGPLKTILDFNIFQYDKNIEKITEPGIWNINGLSYDDI